MNVGVNITLPSIDTGPFAFGGDAPPNMALPDDWKQWFMRVSPQLKAFAPHHENAGDWLESIEMGEKPRPHIDPWPRAHGKSTFAEHGVAYLAERRKRTFALYVGDAQDSAERHVENIKTLLERIGGAVGMRLENKYGHSRGWKKSLIRTASGFNVLALGMDVAMRGVKLEDFRPDLIIFDDIDGRHDTPHVTQKKIETLTESIIPAGSDDSAIWFVQNLVIPNGIMSRLCGVSTHEADFLARRIVNGPVKAVNGLQTEQRFVEELGRRVHIVTGGEPTWGAYTLEDAQEDILEEGWRAFDREKQQNVKDVEGALWSTDLLNETRVADAPEFTRTVVGVDPATTSKDTSDDTGIIAAGRTSGDAGKAAHAYVTADETGTYKPSVWGRRVVALHDEIGADCVVAESNQGGEMVQHVIEGAARAMYEDGTRGTPNIKVKLIHVHDGKRVRAEPVAQLYEEHTAHHVGEWPSLEEEMTTWDASSGQASPNRIDGLGLALTELMLGGQAMTGKGFTADIY